MYVDLCYCQYCIDELEQWGEPARIVFETVCEWYAIHNSALILLPDELSVLQVIDFLEEKRFVLTTDVNEDIAVVPMCAEPINGMWMICLHNEDHGHIIKTPQGDEEP